MTTKVENQVQKEEDKVILSNEDDDEIGMGEQLSTFRTNLSTRLLSVLIYLRLHYLRLFRRP